MTSEDEIIIPQPKRLGVKSSPEGLMQVEIQLRKFKLTVSEADGESRFRLGLLTGELLNEFEVPLNSNNGQEPPVKTDGQRVTENMLLNVWAPLASCSTGEVPTKEQFMKLPEVDLNFWIETARNLGAQFQWLDRMEALFSGEIEPTEKEAQKKGKRSLPRSSPS